MIHVAGRRGAFALVALAAAGVMLVGSGHAHAQTDDDALPAEVRFELGSYDRGSRDWPVSAVLLRGGLLEGELAAVILEDPGGAVLWEGEAEFTGPVTRIAVDQFVPLRAVSHVTLAQQGFGVVSAPVSSPPDEEQPVPTAGPTAATIPGVPPDTQVDEPAEPAAEVGAELIIRPQPFTASASVGDVVSRGVASAPRLVVSLVVLLVVFAIVFRLPLVPVGTQARWRR